MKHIKPGIFAKIYFIYIIFFIFAVGIIARVIYIQFSIGSELVDQVDKQTLKYFNIEAVRGEIMDTNGELIAATVPIFDIRIDLHPSVISDQLFRENVDSLAFALSKTFKTHSASEYKQKLIYGRSKQKRYLLLKRNISYKELKQVKQMPILKEGKYRGGLIIIQKTRREKPFQLLAERTIGFERQGKYLVGLEGAYSHILKGVSGKRLMRNIGNQIWLPVNEENEIEPQDGKDLVTTLDINIQDVVEHALLDQLKKTQADHGCAVLMEVNSGKIRAIANLTRTKNGNYEESYNYAIGEKLEPGSTFKLASVLAVIDDGFLNINDKINVGNGMIRYADKYMRDDHFHGSLLSLKQAFEVSSNVAISKIVYQYYKASPGKFIDKLIQMRLHKPLGVEIKGEGLPYIKAPDDKTWSQITLPWMAIGYELRLTPLQLLAFYNAVANDGKMMKPLFVEEIQKAGKTIKTMPPVILKESIAKKSSVQQVRKLLEAVVENGTAKNIKSDLYKIAGKTGTAQIANTKHGYRSDSIGVTYNASFAGYFPADNPKYSCIVVINKPKAGIFYGSQVAAPVFKEISDKVYATNWDIQPDPKLPEHPRYAPDLFIAGAHDVKNAIKQLNFNVSDDVSGNILVTVKSIENNKNIDLVENDYFEKGKMPDLSGFSVKDAVFLLESNGLQVELTGRGQIIHQSISPGEKYDRGDKIILTLKKKLKEV